MVLIYETENFTVKSKDENPHVTREDGGHIKIFPKDKYVNRQELPPKLAIELMKITVLVGEAMANALSKRGIDIGRINYQDNGNWNAVKPNDSFLSVHLYGRAKSAKIQKYGQALYLPRKEDEPEFYAKNKPLNKGDIIEIKKEITKLLKTKKKYSNIEWRLPK